MRHILAIGMLTACALALGSVEAAGPSRTEADAAFDAGDHERALALYEDVLENDPRDVEALVRSGMILSWSRRHEEAIARYDRALAIDPGNARAAIERAKVLSWSKRYDEAAEAFRAVLEEEPRDREALLGLARSLSWGGTQAEAREVYRRVLAAEPRDAEALVGVAQTYAWSGDATRAREAYDDVLRADPRSKNGTIGLAYLDLEEGDLRSADRRAREAEAAWPGDAEVADLRRSLDRARAAWIEGGWERVDDTDDTTITTWKLEGGTGLPAGFDLRAGLVRYDLATGPLDGTIDSIYGVLGFTPRARHRLEGRIGVDRIEDSTGDRRSDTIGGLAYVFPISSRFAGRVGWDRDTYRYSVPILDNGIRGDLWTARVYGTFATSWRFDGGAGVWDLNDGNRRVGTDAAVLHGWRVGAHTLEAGYGLRYWDWSDDLDNGYFDPSDFNAHLALGRARGPIRERGYYDVTLEAGVQSFSESGRKVSGDPVLSVYAVAGTRLREALLLEGYAAYSTFAQQGGEDYRSRRLGWRLRWTFGLGS